MMKPKTVAILLAGGKGIRMGTGTPKQFLPLAGKPVILHTLEKFQVSDWIDEIVLVLPESNLNFVEQEVLRNRNFSKLKNKVVGGLSRQDSTYEGFKVIDGNPDVVIVHDVARPLLNLETIRQCIEIAFKEGAALAATPASDTIKECDEVGKVIATHPREKIFLAQTPQAARYEILKEALESAYQEGFQGTDEASLIERIGKLVKVVVTDSNNIKLTRPSDFIFAEAILKEIK